MFKRVGGPKSVEELIRRGDDFRIGDREEQSFERALGFYRKAALKGDPRAQYLIGTMYESGHGVAQSYREAAKWYERSFNQGYKKATSAMAFIYESGLGAKRSRALAIEHYTTAAEGGDLRAINNLGLIYKDRSGSKPNYHGAVVFFQKGNLQEYSPCQANLAAMYEKGLDVERNCQTAAVLFKRAARQGSISAKRSLAEMYSFGLGLKQSENISRHLYLEAARWGDPEAIAYLKGEDGGTPDYTPSPEKATIPQDMLALGLRYLDGTTLGLSVPSAMYWLEKAAKAGSATAMYVLGQMYENGYGIEPSSPVALKWYKWGAEKGSGACAYNYAYLYEEAGGDNAPSICISMYRTAVENAEDDDIKSDALYSLGLYYSNGIGVKRSAETSLRYLVQSADLGNAAAQYLAGMMLLGTDVPKASAYLRMAADQGDSRASEALSKVSGQRDGILINEQCHHIAMAMIDIVYIHSGDPKPPAGTEVRRGTVKDMEEYMQHLVFEMKYAGVGTSFKSEEKEGAKNDIVVNGKSVSEILDGLEIRKPELDSEGRPAQIVSIERAPDDWNTEIIEDIPDLLMKNALSKAFADAEKLRIKDLV